MHTNKITHCPSCDSSGSKLVASLQDNDRYEKFKKFSDRKYRGMLHTMLPLEKVAIRKCEQCHHLWYETQPSPHELIRMYNNGIKINSNGRKVSEDRSSYIRKQLSKFFKLNKNRSKKMLDFGSGSGEWSEIAVMLGYQVVAYEPAATRSIKETEKPYLTVNRLEEITGETFDLINLEQVLEHVPSPFTTMKEVAKLMSPASVVRISVPNINRAQEQKTFWSDWPFNGKTPHTMAPFEHLHGFTPNSLRCLMIKSGFEPIPISKILVTDFYTAVKMLITLYLPKIGGTGGYWRLKE